MKAMPDSSTRFFSRRASSASKLRRDSAVDGLARVAGGQDRQRAVPLFGQHQDRVDVFAAARARKPSTCGAEFAGGLFRPMGHLVADRPHLEPVSQSSQGRPMPGFPSLSQPNQSDAKLHGQAGGLRSVA